MVASVKVLLIVSVFSVKWKAKSLGKNGLELLGL